MPPISTMPCLRVRRCIACGRCEVCECECNAYELGLALDPAAATQLVPRPGAVRDDAPPGGAR